MSTPRLHSPSDELVLMEDGPVDADRLRAVCLRLAGRLRALDRGAGGSEVVLPQVVQPESLMPRRPDPSTLERARRLPLFDAFEGREFDALVGGMNEWRLPPGRTIFSQGAPAGSAYLVVRGRVEVWTRRGGKEYRLALGGPGTLLGEVALLDRRPRSMSCRTRDDTVLLELPVDAFVKLWNEKSWACRSLVRVVGRGVLANLHRAHALTERVEARSILRTLVDDVPAAAGAPIGMLSTQFVQPAEDEARLRYERDALLETVARSVIGRDGVAAGPFGARRVLDLDSASGGRALQFIEDFVREEVLAAGSHQTSALLEEARGLLHRELGASSDDVVVFVPGGAAACFRRLVQLLGIRHHDDAERRPVVFVGPYERAANDLPWRESGADVVTIGLQPDGGVHLAQLERELRHHADRPLLVGSFSCGSDVTGVISDEPAITRLLHRHGALAFWDASGVGDRLATRMNPGGTFADPETAKDALVLAPGRFPGGAGAPSVMVLKKALLAGAAPRNARWVSPWSVQFPEGPVEREEDPEVHVAGAVRAALAVQLQRAVGVATIRAREAAILSRARARWTANPNIWLLGGDGGERLGHIALCVRHEGRHLHWGFVAALLRDLFGIRVGRGVGGAGPYAHALLGVDVMTSWTFEDEGNNGFTGLSPGWIQLALPYFASEAEVTYLIEAIDRVARDGWKLLPLYTFDPRTGAWGCVEGMPHTGPRLADVRYPAGAMHYESGRVHEGEEALPGYLALADQVFEIAADLIRDVVAEGIVGTSARFESVRWFPYPQEARELLLGRTLAEEPTNVEPSRRPAASGG